MRSSDKEYVGTEAVDETAGADSTSKPWLMEGKAMAPNESDSYYINYRTGDCVPACLRKEDAVEAAAGTGDLKAQENNWEEGALQIGADDLCRSG